MKMLGIVKDGALLAENGQIVETGSTAHMLKVIDDSTTVVDVHGRLVTPGFVDAHTHLFAEDRLDDFERRSAGATYEEIAQAGGGIHHTVGCTSEASADKIDSYARKHSQWMLGCGTTTAEIKSGYGLSTENELALLSAIARLEQQGPMRVVPTLLAAHACPKQTDTNSFVDEIIGDMLPQVKLQGIAKYCDVFCEAGYFSVDQCRRVLFRAKELGFGLRIHADQLSLGGGAQLAAECGVVTADHLEQTDAAGIDALARAGVIPILLPGSVYALGKTKYPAAREMIDAGLPLVLATDFNPGSSPTPSILMIMSIACTQMRITPAEALCACTVNAGYSLAMGDIVGSLEPGKAADFVIHDLQDYRELAYWFGSPIQRQVFIAGTEV